MLHYLVLSSAESVALRYGQDLYIVAVNRTLETVRATFTALVRSPVDVRVLFEDRVIQQESGIFADAFSPLSRHVYCLRGVYSN